jgi:hypothetical protein
MFYYIYMMQPSDVFPFYHLAPRRKAARRQTGKKEMPFPE